MKNAPTAIRLLIASLALISAPAGARADGTTDIVVNPATGATISAPGSYRLVQDVVMTGDAAAITISASHVTLDLGGHSLTGLQNDEGPSSTHSGIESFGEHTTLFGGSIIAFGGYGVSLQSYSVVHDCRAVSNNKKGNAGGIQVGSESVVSDCLIEDNKPPSSGRTTGLYLGFNCTARNNHLTGNASPDDQAIGISASFNGCVIEGNQIKLCGGAGSSDCIGINAAQRQIIRGNTVQETQTTGTARAIGIWVDSASSVEKNVVVSTQSYATAGDAIGIMAFGSIVVGNMCRWNTANSTANGSGIGIRASDCDVRENNCNGNSGSGTGFGAGILVATFASRVTKNTCAYNAGGAGLGWGIRVEASGTLVDGNFASNDQTAGVMTTVPDVRIISNSFHESTAIDTVNGANPGPNLGTGDLANVNY